MSHKKKNCNEITIGDVKNNSGTTYVAGQNINIYSREQALSQNCKFTQEPLWRSPITQAALTWISFLMGLFDLIPFFGIIKDFYAYFNKNITILSHSSILINSTVFFVILILLRFTVNLRTITKKQTMHPLFFNIAISGYGKRLSFKKIHATCPICGGKMRYYNKPIEWIQDYNSLKKQITKRAPVLECKRSSEHCYYLDPAAESIAHE